MHVTQRFFQLSMSAVCCQKQRCMYKVGLWVTCCVVACSQDNAKQPSYPARPRLEAMLIPSFPFQLLADDMMLTA